MHLAYPGRWPADEVLEDLGATELLMLTSIIQRAVMRATRIECLAIDKSPQRSDMLSDLIDAREWLEFELMGRVFAYQEATPCLMHMGRKGDAYWGPPKTPA